jgi:hypothetical protein
LGAPHVALVGLGDGRELATLARAVRRAWRADPSRKALAVFAWTELTGAMMERYTRATRRVVRGPRKSWRTIPFEDMCRLSLAQDGTRNRWREAIEALVIEGALPFDLICHVGQGNASDILGDLGVLAPLIDDRTIVAITGLSHAGAMNAVRRFMVMHRWHSVILGDVALLSLPPIALPKEDKEHAGPCVVA